MKYPCYWSTSTNVINIFNYIQSCLLEGSPIHISCVTKMFVFLYVYGFHKTFTSKVLRLCVLCSMNVDDNIRIL